VKEGVERCRKESEGKGGCRKVVKKGVGRW
jgi:hypothetical protein